MGQGLFRAEAVASYQNPENRGGLPQAPRPSGLVAAGLVAVVFAAICGALAFVEIDVTVEARGNMQVGAGSAIVRAPFGGQVSKVLVAPGDAVTARSPLVVVSGAEVPSSTTGVVDFVDVSGGERLAPGAVIAEIAPTEGRRVGLLAITASGRSQVSPGMTVRARVPTAGGDELVAKGVVSRISGQPLSRERALSLFGREPEGPLFLVSVDFDDERFQGLPGGTPLAGSIAVDRRTVLALLVPARLRTGG